MIPKGGSAFLTPLFGNWAGKDDITKYFFKDTPLAGLEQQMMTPPNFTPRGGGQMILCRFRYRPEDVDCKNCTKYHKKRDTRRVCPWLEERAEAGVVTYAVLASEFYKHWMDGLLGNRIREVLSGKRRSPITMRVTLPAYRSIPHTWPAIGNVMTEIVVWLLCI